MKIDPFQLASQFNLGPPDPQERDLTHLKTNSGPRHSGGIETSLRLYVPDRGRRFGQRTVSVMMPVDP